METRQDFIDISPEKGGQKGKKFDVFQESEKSQVALNPARLTKEGVQEKIAVWKLSSNSHVVLKYRMMLSTCKNLAPSGTTENGEIILSRNADGSPRNVKAPLVPLHREKKNGSNKSRS